MPYPASRVLEIGIGPGLNLPLYVSQVKEVIGLDPSTELLAIAQRQSHKVSTRVALIEGVAETIPLENGSVDTVVSIVRWCGRDSPRP